MKDNIELNNRKIFFLFSIFVVLTFILLYIVPYTRDDWAWGSSIGLERLAEFFKDYNGRYAGNSTEILLTRFRWLRALVETVVTCGLVYFMVPKGKNRIFFYMLAMCLILLEPVFMLRQTIIYTAGFSNYVIPTLFMICFIRYFEPMLNTDKFEDLRFKTVHAAALVPATFAACLFMEHITLYILSLSAAVIVYSLIKFRKVFTVQIGFFLGSLAGFLIMFSNGAYWNVLSGSDTYRSLGKTASGSDGVADTVVNDHLSDTVHAIYAQNWFFNILLCLTVFVIITKTLNNKKDRSTKTGLMFTGAICSALLAALTILNGTVLLAEKFLGYETFYIEDFNIFLIVLYAALLIACFICLILAVNGRSRKILIFFMGSMAALDLPLLIVNPVSPRCFFPAFILMGMFVLECLRDVPIKKWYPKVIAVVLLLFFSGLFIIYIPLYKADNDRVNYIKEQIRQEKTEIVIGNLPNEEFIWIPTPKTDTKWEHRYKLFHGIPKEINLVNKESQNGIY